MKALILELRDAYAIAMKPGGEVIRIRRKEGLQVGQTVYFLPEDLYSDPAIPFVPKKRHRQLHPARLAGLAAAVVLIVTLLLYPSAPVVCAVASFNGAQGVQLELDKKSRIVGGYSDGVPQETLDTFRGRTLPEVGQELTELVGSGPVLIGYAALDDREDAGMEQLLREMFDGHVVLYLSGNGEDIEIARSSGTSLGLHLAGEAIGEDVWQSLDWLPYGEDDPEDEDSEDIPEDDSEDDALYDYLDELELEDLLEEIRKNPDYEHNEEVMEILADRLEERHEDHKEEAWEDDADSEDSEDPEDSDDDTDD